MASPLADRVRPTNIDEVVGQKHLLGQGKVLRRIIESGNIPNLIFYGPSGVGKTTVANIIAQKSGKKLYKMNATMASTADIKDMISSLGQIDSVGGILLYLDEIQYFSKKQQQTLLEHIENGNVTLIASTTENPHFYVYNAILSRSAVFEFKPLTAQDIVPALHRAAGLLSDELGAEIAFLEDTDHIIAAAGGGDVRKTLGTLELAALTADREGGKIGITREVIEELVPKTALQYDRDGDAHYDIVSAFHKSMRGSDPDATVHYLARLLEAGDLPSACRRLMACACEDVGLAYPQIIPIVKAAVDAALFLGLPEGRLPLADAAILVAMSPKSTTGHDAIGAAMEDLKSVKQGTLSIPRQLQNKHFDGTEVERKGQFYKYPHDYPRHWVEQQYLPDALVGRQYYQFGDNKNEQSFKAYMEWIRGKSK